MSETEVNVKTKGDAEGRTVVSHPPHRTRLTILWDIIEKWFFSTKFAVTAIALIYLRMDHWGDVKVLVSLVDQNQIKGFVDLTQSKNQTTQNILLGFLGFGTVAGIGAGFINRYSQTTTMSRTPARSTKDLD